VWFHGDVNGLNGGFWHWRVFWLATISVAVSPNVQCLFCLISAIKEKHSFPDKTNWLDFYLIW